MENDDLNPLLKVMLRNNRDRAKDQFISEVTAITADLLEDLQKKYGPMAETEALTGEDRGRADVAMLLVEAIKHLRENSGTKKNGDDPSA